MPRTKFVGPQKLTEKEVKDRCIEVGECWEWQQAVDSNGYPIMQFNKACTTVRRLVFTHLLGKRLLPRQPVTMTCGNNLCVNPAHTAATTLSAISRKAAKEGRYQSAKRCGAIAEAMRKRVGKLDIDKVATIRNSDDSIEVLADRYGVCTSSIKKVIAYKSWKEYSSPFQGLMR